MDLRLSSSADRLERSSSGGWLVVSTGEVVEADAVVLATPAPATAALLRPHDDEVAGLLDAIDYASVVLVTFRVDADDIPATLHGTGFLVPRRSPQKGREPWAVTACTYLDRKWQHLDRAGEVLLRGRSGGSTTPAPPGGATRRSRNGPGRSCTRSWAWGASPRQRVTRFVNAFPQYRVHHLLRTAGVESALARLGRVAVAGAAYHGVGIPACIASGRSAARGALVSGRLPRRGRIAAPSVAAGVLLALSLPPWGWWPLGFVGAALLYWRLAGLRLRSRLWSGWLAGLGCYAIGLFWAHAFNWYGAVVLIAIEALFFAAAAGATPPRCGRALAYVGACTLAECVRMTWPFGGLPLGGVFLGQARSPLIELARLGGPLLITAGVWAGGVARSPRSPRPCGRAMAVSTGLPPSAQPRSSSDSSHWP